MVMITPCCCPCVKPAGAALGRVDAGLRLFVQPLRFGDGTPGSRLDLLPPSPGAPGLPELARILMPATAVDRSGNRIGQTGGYYDSFLSALQAQGNNPPAVAVVYDEEVLPHGAIPTEAFDMAVDGPDARRARPLR